jgi:hypothetical protein
MHAARPDEALGNAGMYTATLHFGSAAQILQHSASVITLVLFVQPPGLLQGSPSP